MGRAPAKQEGASRTTCLFWLRFSVLLRTAVRPESGGVGHRGALTQCISVYGHQRRRDGQGRSAFGSPTNERSRSGPFAYMIVERRKRVFLSECPTRAGGGVTPWLVVVSGMDSVSSSEYLGVPLASERAQVSRGGRIRAGRGRAAFAVRRAWRGWDPGHAPHPLPHKPFPGSPLLQGGASCPVQAGCSGVGYSDSAVPLQRVYLQLGFLMRST